MSKQASKTLIGAFVLGAVALAVVAVVVFGSGKFFKQTQTCVMFFSGSVKGLQVGAPVIFQGVKIGQVTDIILRFDPSDLSIVIPVYMELDTSKITIPEKFAYLKKRDGGGEYLRALIEKGLRAQLQLQSFVTGLLVINLDFYPDTVARLVGIDKDHVEIPTVPTPFDQLQKTIEDLNLKELVTDIKSSIKGIEKIVNSPEMTASVKALNETLREAGKFVKNADNQIGPLAESVRETLKDARATLVQIEKTFKTADGVAVEVSASVKETLGTARGTLQKTQDALSTVERIAQQNSNIGYEVSRALEEITKLSRSLRVLADYIDQHPEAFIKGKGSPRGE